MSGRDLFSIGEVARMFHLSPGTLRHYETLGLLTPEYTDPATGYRYYSTRQFEVLNTIRYLRALDLPLGQIGDLLRDRDVDRMEDKLRRQRETVIRRQEELRRVQCKIENRLDQLRSARERPLEEIRREPLHPCRMVWLKRTLRVESFLDLEEPIRTLEQSQEEGLVFLGKVGLGITREHLLAGDYGQYDGAFLVLDREDRFRGEALELPGGECVSLRFRGSHPQAPEHYRALMSFLRENGLEPAGFSREITLIDEGLTRDPEQFVTEIVIPVTPHKNAVFAGTRNRDASAEA